MPRGKITGILIFSILCLIFIPPISVAQNFSEPKRVNDYPNECTDLGSIATCVDNNLTIHVVWMEHRESILLYYAKSEDHGQTFSKSIKVNHTDLLQAYPAIDSDNNCNVHVAWSANRTVYYSKLEVGKYSFNPAIKVSDDDAKDCTGPDIAIDGNNEVHIAWSDSRNSIDNDENVDVFYAKSTNNGNSFGPNIRVDDDEEFYDQYGAAIALDNNNTVHIFYGDDREEIDGDHYTFNIYHTKSVDGGLSFIAHTQVNDHVEEKIVRGGGSIFIDKNDKIHVTFTDYRSDGKGIYYTFSDNKGRSFSKDVMVSKYSERGGLASYSNVYVDDEGVIHFFWSDDRYSGSKYQPAYIYYTNSTDNGVSFNNQINISKDLYLFDCVGLILDNNKFGFLYLTWYGTDLDDNTNVYFSTTISYIDRDGDGYIDSFDAFPDEPTQWHDEDGDGYGDNPYGWYTDIFPSDPTEWFDTDGDGYGDNSDYYPNDPSKHKKEDDIGYLNWIGIFGIIIIIIIVIVIVMFFTVRKKRSKVKTEPSINQYEQGQPQTQYSQYPQQYYQPQTIQPPTYPRQQYQQQEYPPPTLPQQSYPQSGYPVQQDQQQGYPQQNYPQQEPPKRDWSKQDLY